MSMKQFTSAQSHFVSGDFDWYSDPIFAVAVDPNIHKIDYAVDQVLSDIPLEARVALSELITNTHVTETGMMLHDRIHFDSPLDKPQGLIVPGDQLVLFKGTGNEKNSFLIAVSVVTVDDFAKFDSRNTNRHL